MTSLARALALAIFVLEISTFGVHAAGNLPLRAYRQPPPRRAPHQDRVEYRRSPTRRKIDDNETETNAARLPIMVNLAETTARPSPGNRFREVATGFASGATIGVLVGEIVADSNGFARQTAATVAGSAVLQLPWFQSQQRSFWRGFGLICGSAMGITGSFGYMSRGTGQLLDLARWPLRLSLGMMTGLQASLRNLIAVRYSKISRQLQAGDGAPVTVVDIRDL